MIRFKNDDQTLVAVGNWEDMYERVGFQAVVDVAEGDLREILAQYILQPLQPCGISSCRTPHSKGYLVQLTSGYETNIGNICGRKHFGVEFNESRNAFTVALNSQRYRDNIIAVQSRIPGIRERITQQKEGEANRCYKEMWRYMMRLLDEKTTDKLIEMARAGTGEIVREVQLNDEERAAAIEAGALDTNFRTEVVDRITGIQAAVSYRKIAPARFRNLESELNEFAQFDGETAEYKLLKEHHNWANRIDPRLAEFDDIVEDCQRFLAKSNIDRIQARKSDLYAMPRPRS